MSQRWAGVLSSIPSPTQSVWHLGPLPIRAYAMCILGGIVLAAWVGNRRYVARGGRHGVIFDVAAWAVPFGVVGGRIYHVVSSPQAYFGAGGHPLRALAIWEGGLGIWGAVSIGGLGAWIACRRAGVLLPPVADSLAPGIVLAQAVGRFGNWFNNELYGRATDLPWGLTIHEWDQANGQAVRDATGHAVVLGTFHPTFLYESLWNVGVAAVIIWADRRYKLGHGRVFGLYVALYTVGRFWIEALRVDEANHILGLRLNLWTAALVFVGATVGVVVSARRHPGRESYLLRGEPADASGRAEPGEPADASGRAEPGEPADASGRAEPGEPTESEAPAHPTT